MIDDMKCFGDNSLGSGVKKAQAAALMNDGPSGAGMLTVDLQDGLIRTEADRSLVDIILCKAHRKLPVDLLCIRRTDVQRHVDLTDRKSVV